MATATIDDTRELAIFLFTGSTLMFDVTCVIERTEDKLEFEYKSRETGKYKRAEFDRSMIAGFSIEFLDG